MHHDGITKNIQTPAQGSDYGVRNKQYEQISTQQNIPYYAT